MKGEAEMNQMTKPALNAAAGESRKQIAAEISDSVPKRLSGTALVISRNIARTWSG